MSDNLIDVSYWKEDVGIRTFKLKYFAKVSHKELSDVRVFTSDDESILRSKVKAHISKLKERWQRTVLNGNKNASQKEAELRTKEAIKELKRVDNILLHTLDIDDVVDWEMLKDHSKFQMPNFEKELYSQLSKVSKPEKPTLLEYPPAPDIKKYEPKLTFLDKVFKSKANEKIEQASAVVDRLLKQHEEACKLVDQSNKLKNRSYQLSLEHYDNDLQKIRENSELTQREWNEKHQKFYSTPLN